MTDPTQLSGRLLGFDFGLKRIGVAVGNTHAKTAQAHCVVPSQDGRPDWAKITQLFTQWQPVAAVVGLPKRLDGTDQPLTQSARKFGQRLGGRYRLPIYFIEEQLSSVAAENMAPQTKHHSHKHLDDLAAQIILTNWLDSWEKTL